MKTKLIHLFFLLIIHSNLLAQGQTFRDFYNINGQRRNHSLYIPSAYDGTQKWPLVINMHGYTGNASQQQALSKMNAVADTGRFLIVYPEGTLFRTRLSGLPTQGLGWYAGVSGDNEFYPDKPVDDVAYIASLIDSISSKYAVDHRRIYATGYSNGGFMANVLACELSDRIAAIAPVAGTSHKSRPCNPKRKVPILQTHGTRDMILGYDFGTPGSTNKGVPTYLEFWRNLYGCGETPMTQFVPNSVTGDNSTVQILTWPNCTTELVHHKIIDGGHQWPGGADIFTQFGAKNQDIVSSAEIWKFFKRYQLPQTTVPTSDQENPLSIYRKIYPNPTQGQFTVELELPQQESIRFGLYNLAGQSVSNTIVQDLKAGKQSVLLDFSLPKLPPGTYQLQMHFGNRMFAKLINFEK